MSAPRWWAWLPADPPSDEPLPPPSDDPLPAPEDPGPRTEEDDTEEEDEPEPEITDDPLPAPEDPREGESPLSEQQEPSEEELVEIDTDGGMFDCGFMEPSCHISNWFADFVVSGLNPGLAWLAEKAFHTPTPTAGMTALHEGILTTANVLYLLLVVTGGVIVMGYRTVQSRYSIGDILPRLVFGFVAANLSLWLATEMVEASNDIAVAVGAAGIDAEQAAINFRNRIDVLLEETLVFIILLLVVVVILLVVWMISEAVRICMVIVLTIAAPVLLMFHALPHTNRLAELWWRSMAGLCAIPVAQAIAFIAMARLFFEGQMTIFGSDREGPYSFDEEDLALDLGGIGTETVMLASSVFASPDSDVRGSDWLMNIMLLLVLLYVQIRISSWVMKLVWQPNPGTSPIAAMLKNLGWMMAFRSMGNVRLSGLMKNGFDLGLRRPNLSWSRRSRGTGQPLPRDKSRPSSGLQRLQPQAWWYRQRREAPEPVATLSSGEQRRALPGPGGATGPRPPSGPEPGSPRGLPGQPGLPPAPGTRQGRATPGARHVPAAPARRALEEGRMPGSPAAGQQTLFPRPSPPPPKGTTSVHPPRRRWRQGVLPTPPPVRVPGRRPVERVGDLSGPVPAAGLRHLPSMPPLSWRKPPHVKGQQSLAPAPKRVWKQYGLFPKPKK